MARQRVLVIGGGITGLTVCYHLYRAAQARALPLDVTLLEAADRAGGVIATSAQQALLLEHGPDCFISTKPGGVQLCEELGLGAQLISTTAQYRQSFIVRGNRLLPVPQGFYLMVPGALGPFIRSPLVSWRGKLRMALDLLLPRRTATDDEALADFVTRRLGREALERIAQPMVGGIYTADPARLSLQATMPQFAAMEQRHGSLIRAMWQNRQGTPPHSASLPGTSGPRYGLFLSLHQGMQTLTDRLLDCLPAHTVRLRTRVSGVHWQPETCRWLVRCVNQAPLEAEALCLALPAPQAGALLTERARALATALQDIPYASSATVNMAFRRSDIAHPLHGMGFVVPAIEQRTLLACSFSSVKFAGRAPAGQVLLRAFVGGALQHAAYELSDADMQRAVQEDLRQLLGITGAPLYSSVSRHPQSMPQYHVGHQQRIARIEALAQCLPGLALAGNAYHGVGIPDCIQSAAAAAQTLLAYLSHVPAAHAPAPETPVTI
jgi:oxygen-dependent protoporphyrinogen oxidase